MCTHIPLLAIYPPSKSSPSHNNCKHHVTRHPPPHHIVSQDTTVIHKTRQVTSNSAISDSQRWREVCQCSLKFAFQDIFSQQRHVNYVKKETVKSVYLDPSHYWYKSGLLLHPKIKTQAMLHHLPSQYCAEVLENILGLPTTYMHIKLH